jgi:hypothetical protein
MGLRERQRADVRRGGATGRPCTTGSAAAGDWVTGTVAGQPARVAVLHWSKGSWRNVALPEMTVPSGDQMMPGVIAPDITPGSVWATVRVGPVKSGYATTVQGDLELIPGTRSVLAAAELQATPVGYPTEGAILTYGP